VKTPGMVLGWQHIFKPLIFLSALAEHETVGLPKLNYRFWP